MVPKKRRRVTKIEVPTDSIPEFELGDTAADIQQRREEREARDREEARQQQQREEKARREEARAEESHSQEEGHLEKPPRTERNDTETEAAGGEAGTSQSQYKKGHMTNIYLTRLATSKAGQHSKQGRRMWLSATATTATDIFTQLECRMLKTFQQTFQQPQQPVPAAREYILTIPKTQMPASQVIQPDQHSQVATNGQQQQTRRQPNSFQIVDDQQAESSPLMFTKTPTKHFNPPSVASATSEETQYNISGLSSFFGNLQSVMSYQQIDTPQPYSPADTSAPLASPPTTTVTQPQHQQPSAHPSPPPESADTKQQPQ